MALNRNEVGLQFKLTVDSLGAVTEIGRITAAFKTMGSNVRQEVERIQTSLNNLAKTAQRTGDSVGESLRDPVDSVRPAVSRLSDAFANLGNVLTVGVTLPLAGLSAAAIKSAVDLDKTRARLAALMGSTEEANRVIGELNKLVAQTPGLTSAFAMDAFAQMRALGTIGEESIMKLTASLGRLNAVFTLQDPQQFIRNITQIFTQGFERADVKEALGQVPIFEQLLEQAFGTKDAAKLRQLKEAGALTSDTYFQGLIEAIDRNPAFANAQETIAGRFAKLTAQLQTALVPLGERLLAAIIPAIERLAPILIGMLDTFSKMSPALQNTVITGGAFLAFLGPAIRLTAELRTAFASLMVILTAGTGGGLIGALGRLRIALGALAMSNPVTAAVLGALTAIGAAFLYINNQLDGLTTKTKAFAVALAGIAGGGGAAVLSAIAGVAERRRTPAVTPEQPATQQATDTESIRQRLADQLKLTTEGQKKLTQRTVDYQKLVRQIVEEDNRQQLRLIEAQTAQRLALLNRRIKDEEVEQQLAAVNVLLLDKKLKDDQIAIARAKDKELRDLVAEPLRLQIQQINNEIAALGAEGDRLRRDQARTKSAEERLNIEREIVRITGEQALKLVEIDRLLQERAQREPLPLFEIDPAQVEQAIEKVDPLLQAFRDRQKARAEEIARLEVDAIRTRTEIIKIENQVDLGMMTRTQAQEKINSLLKQERDQRIAALQVQLQALDISEQQRASLEQQIVALQTQGETTRQMGMGEALESVFKSIRKPSEMVVDMLINIQRGAEQMLESFILTGELSGQAFLKMARSAIAAMTAEAAVAAIMQLAKGFAMLAIGNFPGAAKAFTSATLFKAVGGAAAGFAASAALGAIAPGGATESGGTGGRFVTGGGGQPETISLIQGQQGNRREPQVIVIRAETEPGVVIRKVMENYRENGEMRQLIRQDIMAGGTI